MENERLIVNEIVLFRYYLQPTSGNIKKKETLVSESLGVENNQRSQKFTYIKPKTC